MARKLSQSKAAKYQRERRAQSKPRAKRGKGIAKLLGQLKPVEGEPIEPAVVRLAPVSKDVEIHNTGTMQELRHEKKLLAAEIAQRLGELEDDYGVTVSGIMFHRDIEHRAVKNRVDIEVTVE